MILAATPQSPRGTLNLVRKKRNAFFLVSELLWVSHIFSCHSRLPKSSNKVSLSAPWKLYLGQQAFWKGQVRNILSWADHWDRNQSDYVSASLSPQPILLDMQIVTSRGKVPSINKGNATAQHSLLHSHSHSASFFLILNDSHAGRRTWDWPDWQNGELGSWCLLDGEALSRVPVQLLFHGQGAMSCTNTDRGVCHNLGHS